MLKSSFCDYSYVYILVKGFISIAAQVWDNPNNVDKEVVFKNCTPFTDCISEINNTQIENAKNNDVVMPMYNLIEYSKNHSKTSGSSWQYHRDELALTYAGTVAKFHAANNSTLLKFQQKITGKTYAANSRKNVAMTLS